MRVGACVRGVHVCVRTFVSWLVRVRVCLPEGHSEVGNEEFINAKFVRHGNLEYVVHHSRYCTSVIVKHTLLCTRALLDIK